MKLDKDIILSEKGSLTFADGIIYPEEPEIITIKDALPVLYEKLKATDEILYYKYKNIYFEEDEAIFKEYNIRQDITVLSPGKIGKEYKKTIGHFHPLKNTGKETYPEYYQVVNGEAIILLQKNGRNNEVEEIIAIEVKKGDYVFIPANYGHIAINTSDDFLILANLIAANLETLNEAFIEKSGAAYYYIETKKGKGDWVKNPEYKMSVGLKIKCAPNLEQPIIIADGKTLYQEFIENPQNFTILTT
jgi:glucose-6-phosphate isomerase